ncbi:hypothetical protein BHE74_00033919 [Ensete ventricosum]|nr:hypothetical protein BHE74_00033919 [Ensete ventricosum]
MGRAPGPSLGGRLLVVELRSGGCVSAPVDRRGLQEGQVGSGPDVAPPTVKLVLLLILRSPTLRRGAGAFIATVTGYPYLNPLSSLLLTIPLHLTMSFVVLATRHAPATEGCRPPHLTCELNSGANPGDLAEKVNSSTNPEDLVKKVNSGINPGDLAEKVSSGTNPGDLAEKMSSGTNSRDLAERVNSGINPGDLTERVRDPEANSSGVSSGPPSLIDARVLRDLEVMKVDHDLDTTVTEGSLAVIRGRYSIPVEYGLHVPRPGQCPYSSDACPTCSSRWMLWRPVSNWMDLGDLRGMPKMSNGKAPSTHAVAPAREVGVSPAREAPKASLKRPIDAPTEQANDPARRHKKVKVLTRRHKSWYGEGESRSHSKGKEPAAPSEELDTLAESDEGDASPVHHRPRSMKDLFKTKVHKGNAGYYTLQMSDLGHQDLDKEMKARWRGLKNSTKVWNDSSAAEEFERGLLHPQLVRELYTLPSEVLLARAAKDIVLIVLFDRVHDAGRLIAFMDYRISQLQQELDTLKSGRGPKVVAKVEERASELEQELEKTKLE